MHYTTHLHIHHVNHFRSLTNSSFLQTDVQSNINTCSVLIQ
eukprot:UN11562